MLSANAFNLDKSKMFLFGIGLILYYTTKFQSCPNWKHMKMTISTEKHEICIRKEILLEKKKKKMLVSSIFHLFPLCFPKLSSKAVFQSCFPKLFSKAVFQSCFPKLSSKAVFKSRFPKLSSFRCFTVGILWLKVHSLVFAKQLTHYQTTNFILVQIETVCRRQF